MTLEFSLYSEVQISEQREVTAYFYTTMTFAWMEKEVSQDISLVWHPQVSCIITCTNLLGM
jgi:hypothetical protein